MPITVVLKTYRFSRTARFFPSFGGGAAWLVSGGFTLGFAPLALYHTTVEIRTAGNRRLEFEYTMGGMRMVAPESNTDFVLLEAKDLGETALNVVDILREYARLKAEWKKYPYSIRNRNCHHFSAAFLAALGFPNAIPDDVTRAHRFLRWIKPVEEKMIARVDEKKK